jgi:hypothetical protein
MNNQDNNQFLTFPIRFSDWRRDKVIKQNQSGYLNRQQSLLETFTFNFLPTAITSSILAPLNRIKVILQVQTLIPGAENLTATKVLNNIKSEESYLALFKGNKSYTLKFFMQFTMKTGIFDRLKYRKDELRTKVRNMKFKILGFDYFMNFIYAVVASSLTLLVSHPFDMAYARIAGQYKIDKNYRMSYHTYKDTFHTAIPQENSPFFKKYYDGLFYAAIQSIIYSSFTLVGFSLISYLNFEENKSEKYSSRYMNILGGPAIVAIITGIITYPLDTLKRQSQVQSAKGFSYLPRHDIMLELKNHPKNFYKGYHIHLMRSIPFSYIQFFIFQNFVSFLNFTKKE